MKVRLRAGSAGRAVCDALAFVGVPVQSEWLARRTGLDLRLVERVCLRLFGAGVLTVPPRPSGVPRRWALSDSGWAMLVGAPRVVA